MFELNILNVALLVIVIIVLYNVLFTGNTEEGFAMNKFLCKAKIKKDPEAAWAEWFAEGKPCARHSGNWKAWTGEDPPTTGEADSSSDEQPSFDSISDEVEGTESSDGTDELTLDDSSAPAAPAEVAARDEYLELVGKLGSIKQEAELISKVTGSDEYQNYMKGDSLNEINDSISGISDNMEKIVKSLEGLMEKAPSKEELDSQYADTFRKGWFVSVYNLNMTGGNKIDGKHLMRYERDNQALRLWNVKDACVQPNSSGTFTFTLLDGEEERQTTVNSKMMVMSAMGYIAVDDEMTLQLKVNGKDNGGKLMYKTLNSDLFKDPSLVSSGPWIMNKESEKMTLKKGDVLLLRFDRSVANTTTKNACIVYKRYAGEMSTDWKNLPMVKNSYMWDNINAGSVGILSTVDEEYGGFISGMVTNVRYVEGGSGNKPYIGSMSQYPHAVAGVKSINFDVGGGYPRLTDGTNYNTGHVDRVYMVSKFMFISEGGDYQFRVRTDDGSMLRYALLSESELTNWSKHDKYQWYKQALTPGMKMPQNMTAISGYPTPLMYNTIINSWKGQAPTVHTSRTVNFKKGQIVEMVYDWYEWGGGATSQLKWKRPSNAKWEPVSTPHIFSHSRQLTPNVVFEKYTGNTWQPLEKNKMLGTFYLPPLFKLTFDLFVGKMPSRPGWYNIIHVMNSTSKNYQHGKYRSRTPAIWLNGNGGIHFVSGDTVNPNRHLNTYDFKNRTNEEKYILKYRTGQTIRFEIVRYRHETMIYLTQNGNKIFLERFPHPRNARYATYEGAHFFAADPWHGALPGWKIRNIKVESMLRYLK